MFHWQDNRDFGMRNAQARRRNQYRRTTLSARSNGRAGNVPGQDMYQLACLVWARAFDLQIRQQTHLEEILAAFGIPQDGPRWFSQVPSFSTGLHFVDTIQTKVRPERF
jgi:hypothetical protein